MNIEVGQYYRHTYTGEIIKIVDDCSRSITFKGMVRYSTECEVYGDRQFFMYKHVLEDNYVLIKGYETKLYRTIND